MAKKSKADPPKVPAVAVPEPPAPVAAAPKRDLRRWYRPHLLLPAVLLLTGAVAWPLLQSSLPDLANHPSYRLSIEQIEVTQPPHWVPHDLVQQVIQQANLPDEFSLLDEDLTRDVAEAFALHPWVENVVSVTKVTPPAVQVKLEYRRPIAMVQLKQGMYPVDVHGVLLPPADFSVSDTRLYPIITHVDSTPQGPAGTSWGDPVVIHAAKLAVELAPHWKKFELAAIECPPAGGARIEDGTFTLLSSGGSRIVWGRGPGTDHPGELSTDKKIGRLKKYVADFGGFDRPHGPYEIDIRHWQEISRRKLTASRAVEAPQRQ